MKLLDTLTKQMELGEKADRAGAAGAHYSFLLLDEKIIIRKGLYNINKLVYKIEKTVYRVF